MPELLHEEWQPDDAGLTIVMEDLRGNTKPPSTASLTHQALALDYHQVGGEIRSCIFLEPHQSNISSGVLTHVHALFAFSTPNSLNSLRLDLWF